VEKKGINGEIRYARRTNMAPKELALSNRRENSKRKEGGEATATQTSKARKFVSTTKRQANADLAQGVAGYMSTQGGLNDDNRVNPREGNPSTWLKRSLRRRKPR
jgi:hypothetical protein